MISPFYLSSTVSFFIPIALGY